MYTTDIVWTSKEFRYWGKVDDQPPFWMEWTGVDKIVWGPVPTVTLYGYLPKAEWMTRPPDVMQVECWGGPCRAPNEYAAGVLRWRAEGARPQEYWTPTMPLDEDIVMSVYLTLRCDSLVVYSRD